MLKQFFKNLKPVGDRVLVKFIKFSKEETTKAGIVIPAILKEEKIAQVMEVGEGVDTSKIKFTTGDYVIFNEFDMKKIEDHDGTEYGLVRYDNIWAIFEINE
jgi:co-chaperonin GroES (HSP10)